MHWLRTTAIWLALACLAAPALAGGPHVRATLVADVQGVAPGGAFRLGVLLDVEEGWHVYWRNPGDAGLSTDVEFHLPDGFTGGDVQWPVPKVFVQPGGLVGYGYEGSVLHWVTVLAPKGLRLGSSVSLAAEAAWLACKDVCVPDGGPLELVLPVTAAAEPANRKLFAGWQARLPVPPAQARELASVTVTGSIPAGGEAGAFEIVAAWRAPVRNVAWCPAAGGGVGVEDITLSRGGPVDKIRFRTLLFRDGGGRILESVLLYTGRDGRSRGVSVPVPLRAGE
ncbi:hypothetical protein HQ560_00845 [bacterium]|nr:hypothetical protein [bacterium]